MISITATLSSLGQGLVKGIQDAKIGESIQNGMTSVRNKLNDPEFQKDVKNKAEAGWSWLSSTAGSLWSAAKDAASQIANDFNEASGSTPRSQSQSRGVSKQDSPRPSGELSDDDSQSRRQPTPIGVDSDDNSDIENDDDWMEKELAKAK